MRPAAIAVSVAMMATTVPSLAQQKTPAAATTAPPMASPAPSNAPAGPPPPLPPPPAAPAPAPSNASVPQPVPPPAAVPAPTPRELNERRVAVDIESSKPSAVVERQVSTNEGSGILFFDTKGSIWEQVCVTPCQTHLDKFSAYRVSSQNKIAASEPFTLPQGTDALKLHIEAGDLNQHRAARAVTTIGSTALIIGIALLAASHAFNDETSVRTGGWITGAAGVGLLAAGIPWLILTNTHVATDGKDL